MKLLILLLATLALAEAADQAAADDPLQKVLETPSEGAPEAEEVLKRLAELVSGLETPEARMPFLEAQVQLLRLLGRNEEALAIVRSLPDSPGSRLEQAQLLLELGEADEAEKILQELAGRVPEAGEGEAGARALYLLAGVHLAATRPELAEPLLVRLRTDYPQAEVLPAALLAWYESLAARGQSEQAQAVLGELRTRFPNSPEVALASPAEDAPRVRYASIPKRLLNPAALSPPAAPVAPQEAPGQVLVQVGSFRNPENAHFLVRDLKDRGFDARIVERKADAQLYYRVVVGPEQSLAAAQQALLRLKDAGFEGIVLLPD